MQTHSIAMGIAEYIKSPLVLNILLSLCVVALGVAARFLIVETCQRSWVRWRGLGKVSRGISLRCHFSLSIWILITALLFEIVFPLFSLSDEDHKSYLKVVHLIAILSGTWTLSRVVSLLCTVLYDRFDINVLDNLMRRALHTQVQFIEKLLLLFVWIVGVSATLLLFDGVRKLGTSLIASAGLAGVIIGFAAQRSLSNLLAGMQIAFTQPIRIDDVVVLEGEWGKVEEITLTYVVVCLWDLRRLILPITYFTEKPFQNWTRKNSEIIGSIFIYTDYTIPVESVRREFHRLLESNSLWDKKVAALQVTSASERALEIRGIMSSIDSNQSFDLRCFMREKLIEYIQKNYSVHLIKNRIRIEDPSSY